MVRDRSRRSVIAAVSTILWLGYMVVGLTVINTIWPTVGGEGPEGTAAFVGLVWGVVTVGLVMWAVSD
jgi:membrane-associated HD superfamily phosphohydrolase